tara:strand:- start:16836 stop:17324 length:489 start_codon:yes stop_codon:yes gene_type:complete
MNKPTKAKTYNALVELWETYGNKEIHFSEQVDIFTKHRVSRTLSTVLVAIGCAIRPERGYLQLTVAPSLAMVDKISDYQIAYCKKINSDRRERIKQEKTRARQGALPPMVDPMAGRPTPNNAFPSMPNPSPYNNTTEMQAISLLKSLGYKIMKPVAPQFEEL